MFETTKAFHVAVKFDALRSFYDFLARRIHLRHVSAKREHDEVGTSSTPVEASPPLQEPVNRVTKQGRFDWGSFSAFEDGSIELEIAGTKQWFRDFSELKRSLKHGTYHSSAAAPFFTDKNSCLTSGKQ